MRTCVKPRERRPCRDRSPPRLTAQPETLLLVWRSSSPPCCVIGAPLAGPGAGGTGSAVPTSLGPPPCLPEDKPSSPNTGPAGAPLNRQGPRPHALTRVQGPAGAARRDLKQHTFVTSSSWRPEGCHAPGVLDQGVDQGVGRAASLLGLQGIIRSLVSFEPVLLGCWRLCPPSTSAVASQASSQL